MKAWKKWEVYVTEKQDRALAERFTVMQEQATAIGHAQSMDLMATCKAFTKTYRQWRK